MTTTWLRWFNCGRDAAADVSGAGRAIGQKLAELGVDPNAV